MTTIRALLNGATATIVTVGMGLQPLEDETKRPKPVSFRTFGQIPERAVRVNPCH
jgi:hypothetical protein